MPGAVPPPRCGRQAAGENEKLRVALLAYRGNPRVGGQGVYCRFLSRELVRLGHQVTVFSGPPWPVLDEGTSLVKIPSLDLYREPDPFRVPHLSELRSWADVAEVLTMWSGGFPEPRTFSWRARRLLGRWPVDPETAALGNGALGNGARAFDVVHDNGSFGSGIAGLVADGWPVVGTCHHPITVDRLVDLAAAGPYWKELSVKRWYGFVRMQNAVAQRLARVLTVSSSSRRDIIEQMGVAPERVSVVPIGTDTGLFRPLPGGPGRRPPGRVMTTASADVPMKGLVYLLEALAKLRTEQPDAHLVVVGEPRPASTAAITRFGLEGAVTFRPGVSDAELVELYSEASVAAVPSLYEGFSLPAVEAMACEVPVVCSSGGALPEVVGRDGEAALLVPPADPGALAQALGRVLASYTDAPNSSAGSQPGHAGAAGPLAGRLGRAGRRRVLGRFTWERCASGVVEQYRAVLDEHARARSETARARRPRGSRGRFGPPRT
ncbi:MAG: glycosyltransferase family 4 protein [Actinomycetota bacterium]|jgi:glycosyltransferase involved in cell wall biosynthesis|nr:glycosyltransferase family 4 protein [Actinomycetota bacterium]